MRRMRFTVVAVLIPLLHLAATTMSGADSRYRMPDHTLEAASERPHMATLRATARELAAEGKASSRTALYDIIFPKNKDEYERMAGYALLLVTAVVQAGDDLPVERVYVTNDTLAIWLELVAALSSRVPASDSTIQRVLGSYRTDSVYLFPVVARMMDASLIVEFRNGDILHLDRFPGAVPFLELRNLPNTPPTRRPNPAAVADVLRREFEDFRGGAREIP